jgi:hypothetical protein
MVALVGADVTLAADFEEYYAVIDQTTKLSHRRQTTNDIMTGVNIIFLTGLGAVFIVGHLASWWVTVVYVLITIFALLFDMTWIRLLNRYSRVIGLRISYLEALESRLRDAGAFAALEIRPDKAPHPITTRGIYTMEHTVLYGPGNHGGFTRRERFIVILFMAAYLILTAGVAMLTLLIAWGVLPILTL